MLQYWYSSTNSSAVVLQCTMDYPATGRSQKSRPQQHNEVTVRLTQTQIDLPLSPVLICPQGAVNTAKCWQNCILNHIDAFDSKGARAHHMNSDWLLKRARGGDMW